MPVLKPLCPNVPELSQHKLSAQCCPEAAVGSAPAQHSDPTQMLLGPGTGEISTGKQTLREMGQNQHRRETSEAAELREQGTYTGYGTKWSQGFWRECIKLQMVQKEGKES